MLAFMKKKPLDDMSCTYNDNIEIIFCRKRTFPSIVKSNLPKRYAMPVARH